MYEVLSSSGMTVVIPDTALEDHNCKVEVNGKSLYLPLNFYAHGIDIPWLKQIKKADDLRGKHCRSKFGRLMREWREEAMNREATELSPTDLVDLQLVVP